MNPAFDSILLVGFGGPTKGCCRRYEDCPGEAFCYVQNVVGERAGSDERIREVAEHYNHFGGVSPFTYFSQKQAGALEMALQSAGLDLPVYTGYRFWSPYVKDTLADMHHTGLRRALGIVLAPHRAKASWEAYIGTVRAARGELGGEAPEVEFLDTPWFEHPGFIRACADRVCQAVQVLSEEDFRRARLIFTAHSIPVSMARTSPYESEFRRTAALVAEALGREDYAVGFQSSPDVPPGTWLEPDVLDVIDEAAKEGAKDVILAPLGFICDHVEVLYDLDIESREAAEKHGLRFFRAGTVGTHPAFIGMWSELAAARVAGKVV